jgi:hypothetical protein
MTKAQTIDLLKSIGVLSKKDKLTKFGKNVFSAMSLNLKPSSLYKEIKN